jgi:hypothetical protein
MDFVVWIIFWTAVSVLIFFSYSQETPHPQPQLKYRGCWGDDWHRAMPRRGSNSNSVLECAQALKNGEIKRKYRYVSLQNGECRYGEREGTEPTSEGPGNQGYKMYGSEGSQCQPDDGGYMYGGEWSNAVYEVV